MAPLRLIGLPSPAAMQREALAEPAIMTHGNKGADAHQGLHVWSRNSGT